MKNVFIITPSSLMTKKRVYAYGLKELARLGLHVLNPDFPETPLTPREKAEQLHGALKDPDIDLVLAQRGGYSAMKALPFLDFDLIAEHPKPIAGFSDLSAWLNPIFERTGMVTLHAPMVLNLDAPTDFTLRSLRNALGGYPETSLLKGAPFTVYTPGRASGTLKGGNLITLTAMIGTDWEIDTEGAILFLEDVDEELYEVDRYLTQWHLAGKLKGLKGLILGDFRGIRSRQVFAILTSQMSPEFPVVHTPCIGHARDKITLPIGAEVLLDTAKKQLEITDISFPGGAR